MDMMLPRIAAVLAAAPATVVVTWAGRDGTDSVDLGGWIAKGGDTLAPLADPKTFGRATVGEYGANLTWDGDEGDLAIDAVHLEMLAGEQRPWGATEAAAWQDAMKLSNREAADLLGIVPSTWNAYKAGSRVPTAIAIACRAAVRDPVILQAHLRPARSAGRPRKAIGGPAT